MHKCDSIQKDKMQLWDNSKRQKTDRTKYNQVLLRQKKWQNTKSQKANVTKCKKIEYKYDKMQKDKLQMWQNAMQNRLWQCCAYGFVGYGNGVQLFDRKDIIDLPKRRLWPLL